MAVDIHRSEVVPSGNGYIWTCNCDVECRETFVGYVGAQIDMMRHWRTAPAHMKEIQPPWPRHLRAQSAIESLEDTRDA